MKRRMSRWRSGLVAFDDGLERQRRVFRCRRARGDVLLVPRSHQQPGRPWLFRQLTFGGFHGRSGRSVWKGSTNASSCGREIAVSPPVTPSLVRAVPRPEPSVRCLASLCAGTAFPFCPPMSSSGGPCAGAAISLPDSRSTALGAIESRNLRCRSNPWLRERGRTQLGNNQTCEQSVVGTLVNNNPSSRPRHQESGNSPTAQRRQRTRCQQGSISMSQKRQVNK